VNGKCHSVQTDSENNLAGGQVLGCTFARIDKLAWDMQTRTVELTVTSFREQEITLIARYGIEEITAPAGVLAAKLKPGTANCDRICRKEKL